MDTPDRNAVTSALPGLLARLRHPHLFVLLLVLFLADLVLPDMIPFVDEILLAILTVLLGTWRRPRAEDEPPPPSPPPALPGA